MQNGDLFVSKITEWIRISMHRSNRDFFSYARETGLSMSQLGALMHLHHHGRSAVTDLGNDLGVTSSAASQLLERLVQQGLILRREDPDDRRVKQIVLTDQGLQVIQNSINARQSWLVELAESLSDKERETITTALNILIDKAGSLDWPDDRD